jgi:hypothetical protein
VIVGLLLSYALTYYFAELAMAESPPGFWLSFYASWVSGLLFFTVVGLILGLVTLYRPERDVFGARVRILTGGKSGPAVDYLASELLRMGYAAQQLTRIVTIEDYDAKLNAFKARVSQSAVISNIYDDVGAQATGEVKFTPDEIAGAPQVLGQCTSFRVNGTTQPGLPFDITSAGMRRSWEMKLPGGGAGELEYEHWAWYLATETHEFAPHYTPPRCGVPMSLQTVTEAPFVEINQLTGEWRAYSRLGHRLPDILA